jgi:hypothetical protein
VLTRKSSRSAAVAAVFACGVAAVGLAAPASADTLADQYVEVPQCQPNTSQSCPQAPQVHFDLPAGGKVQASFTANANHCSDIQVRFLKNTKSMGFYPASDWLQAGPGQTVTSPMISDLATGDLKIQAQGVPGGCNTGHLDAWGGTVHVESTGVPDVDAPKPPQILPNLDDLFGGGA